MKNLFCKYCVWLVHHPDACHFVFYLYSAMGCLWIPYTFVKLGCEANFSFVSFFFFFGIFFVIPGHVVMERAFLDFGNIILEKGKNK